VITGLRHLGRPAESNLAQALVALGEVQMKQGQPNAAQTAFQEAVTLRAKSPSDRWESATARERLGESLARSRQPEAADLLRNAARDLDAELGATHPETLRAKAAVAQLAANSAR
jgi:tetratricopeptide (TPR) repeat protein